MSRMNLRLHHRAEPRHRPAPRIRPKREEASEAATDHRAIPGTLHRSRHESNSVTCPCHAHGCPIRSKQNRIGLTARSAPREGKIARVCHRGINRPPASHSPDRPRKLSLSAPEPHAAVIGFNRTRPAHNHFKDSQVLSSRARGPRVEREPITSVKSLDLLGELKET